MGESFEKAFQDLINLINWTVEIGLLTRDEADELIAFAEKYAEFQEKFGKTKEEIYAEIGEDLSKKILENVSQKKAGGLVDEKIMELLKNIPCIKLPELKGIGPLDLIKTRLFYLSVLGLIDRRFITTGYLKPRPEDPLIPTNLSYVPLNLASFVDEKNLRDIVIDAVSGLYSLPRPSLYFREDIAQELREEFYDRIKVLLIRVKHKFKENIEPLQDSLNFYNRSLALYTPESESMHIFSTSSGIVIPEEYAGDLIKKKNPYRRKYFDKGIASPSAYSLPKYYQWDSETTPKNLWKGYMEAEDKEKYKERAVGVLTKFLQVPNLEITEAPFREDPWKIFFTLVSGRTIVFSERGEARKINKGIIVNQEVLKQNKEYYDEIASFLGRREDGIIGSIKAAYSRRIVNIYKRLNDVWKPEDAEKLAKDFVEHLLEKGKRLVQKEEEMLRPVVVPAEKRIKREKPFARMWSPEIESRRGKPISKEEFEEIKQKIKEFDLFVINDESTNKIEFYKKGQKINIDKPHEDSYLRRAERYLLFHVLKNKGTAGDMDYLLKTVFKWMRSGKIFKKGGEDIEHITSGIRTHISRLSSFLGKNLDINLRSKRKKIYKLTRPLNYIYIEIY